MQKAFTMVELVFIAIVIGILSALALPHFNDSQLFETANQIASHIRYTQHLAMQDDKFVPNATLSQYTNTIQQNKEAQFWYKGRWQISFFTVKGKLTYTIFSDSPSMSTSALSKNRYDGSPNQSATYHEVARNPKNTNRFLIGLKHASFTAGLNHITDKLNLSKQGIKKVVFAGGCATAKRIAFDYMGRPISGDLSTSTAPYQANRLIQQTCTISLCKANPCPPNNDYQDRIDIAIEPETGYTYLLPKA